MDEDVKILHIYYMSCGDVVWRSVKHNKEDKRLCVTHLDAIIMYWERHTVWVKGL